MNPWLCSRGHDKNVVGVDNRSYCKECRRVTRREHYRKGQSANPRAKAFAVPMTGLAEIRKREGYTQRDVARASDLSLSFVNYLENGRSKANRETQRKLLKGLVELRKGRQAMQKRMERAGLL